MKNINIMLVLAIMINATSVVAETQKFVLEYRVQDNTGKKLLPIVSTATNEGFEKIQTLVIEKNPCLSGITEFVIGNESRSDRLPTITFTYTQRVTILQPVINTRGDERNFPYETIDIKIDSPAVTNSFRFKIMDETTKDICKNGADGLYNLMKDAYEKSLRAKAQVNEAFNGSPGTR